MRTEIIIDNPPKEYPDTVMVAYGLDESPYPGYFLTLFTENHCGGTEFDKYTQLVPTHGWDTRSNMALGDRIECPVNRMTIVEVMKLFTDIPLADSTKIAHDLTVGD